MSKEICISSTPHETRLAILENDQLTEVYYERENEYTLAGSIYKGRVTRVLPGMQSAFVDLGLERDAFLYVTDFMEEQEDSSDFERLPASGRSEEAPAVREPREPREAREPREPREPREQRAPRQPQAAAEPSAVVPRSVAAPAEGQAPGGEFTDGTRRWRGRRGRKRGGPRAGQQGNGGPGVPQQAAAQDEAQYSPAADFHEESAPVEHFAAAPEGRASAPTFSLPGESLSKYGGQPAAETRKTPAPAVESRPAANFYKPATLVEAPIEWNGLGPLPGESISRYRGPALESAAPAVEVQPEPYGVTPPIFEDAASHENLSAHTPIAEDVVESEIVPLAAGPVELLEESPAPVAEEVIVEDATEFEPEDASASYRVDRSAPSEFRFTPAAEVAEEEAVAAEPEFGEPEMFAPPVAEPEVHGPEVHEPEVHEPVVHEPVVLVAPHPEVEHATVNHAAEEVGVDLRPVESEVEEAEMSGAASTGIAELDADFDEVDEDDGFDPATGLVEEEEVTEEEEFDLEPLFVDGEEHDIEELEEETLDHEITTGGEIGDLVREAHLDKRVNEEQAPDHAGSYPAGDLLVEDAQEEGEEDEEFADESEEEPAVAAAPGQPERRPRDDQRKGGRGRDGRRRPNGRRQSAQTSDLPIISELLKQGQEILVQIAKEPIAKKGARITSHIALPGRFLVFMPTVNHVGVSRKISSDEERARLKRILTSEKGGTSGGFIVRTAADGASEEDLRADIRFLISLWTEIKQRSDSAKAPSLIYHDLNLVERILRDQVSDNFSTIWVDTESEYERIVRFLERFQPSLVRRVKLYTKETPLFEQFGIQEEIGKALKSKVWLKSGGSIVINQTEALVAIDINTGKYVGKTARLEDTILKTNLDAIPEIVRQIRLRDLGGIIVIDFIDMDERKNRNKVMQALEEELKSDRAPSKVLQFNDFGLVAITRKRVKQSLERTLSTQCSICAGTGMVKSPATVCNEIFIELRKMQRSLERQDVLLRVHPDVVKNLKLNNARWLGELEEMSGKTIIVKSDPALHPEQFDIH